MTLPILEPRSSDIRVLLINRKLYVRYIFGELDGGTDTRDAGSDVDDFQRPRLVDSPFGDKRMGILSAGLVVTDRTHTGDFLGGSKLGSLLEDIVEE